MNFYYPFSFLSLKAQKWAFVIFLVLTILLMVALQLLGAPLITDAAPLGIVSFELAGELSLAREIIASWGPEGKVYAGLNLGLDYLFIVVYASAIALGCILVAQSMTKRMTSLVLPGVVLAWSQIAAALLDAIENYALIKVLLGSGQEIWPLIARWSALPKFAIVVLGIFYIFLGLILCFAVKSQSDSECSFKME